MTQKTDTPAITPTITTTIQQRGAGQLTLEDLRTFRDATRELGDDSTVEIDTEQSYDSDARQVIYKSWTLTVKNTTATVPA